MVESVVVEEELSTEAMLDLLDLTKNETRVLYSGLEVVEELL